LKDDYVRVFYTLWKDDMKAEVNFVQAVCYMTRSITLYKGHITLYYYYTPSKMS